MDEITGGETGVGEIDIYRERRENPERAAVNFLLAS